MKIALRKTSLIDYPGLVSSVLFLSGCNLRCPWCQNRELITGAPSEPEDQSFSGQSFRNISPLIDLDEGIAHITKRKPVLGGVVISGGEPCLYEGLPDLMIKIKKLSLPVKLDTNGMCPAMLEELFRYEETRPDYIALDLKIAPSRYSELVASTPNSSHRGTETQSKEKELLNSTSPSVPLCLRERHFQDNLIQSAALLRQSGIAHEYRTLALPGNYINEKDIEALAPLADGAPWYFRPFRAGNCLDPDWDSREESAEKASALAETLAAKARELGKKAISR